MAYVTIRNMATGAKHVLDGVGGVATIGELKPKIESTMDIPSEIQILVGRNGQTLLLDNDLELSNRLEMSVIDVYTKISSPQSVKIEIAAGSDRHKLNVSSHQTVAHLRMEMDYVLGRTRYGRRFVTLQAVMSNDDDQLFEYLLDPLPKGFVQVIRVFEEDRPSSQQSCSSQHSSSSSDHQHPPSSDQEFPLSSDHQHLQSSDQEHPPSSRYNCCCNM